MTSASECKVGSDGLLCTFLSPYGESPSSNSLDASIGGGSGLPFRLGKGTNFSAALYPSGIIDLTSVSQE